MHVAIKYQSLFRIIIFYVYNYLTISLKTASLFFILTFYFKVRLWHMGVLPQVYPKIITVLAKNYHCTCFPHFNYYQKILTVWHPDFHVSEPANTYLVYVLGGAANAPVLPTVGLRLTASIISVLSDAQFVVGLRWPGLTSFGTTLARRGLDNKSQCRSGNYDIQATNRLWTAYTIVHNYTFIFTEKKFESAAYTLSSH